MDVTATNVSLWRHPGLMSVKVAGSVLQVNELRIFHTARDGMGRGESVVVPGRVIAGEAKPGTQWLMKFTATGFPSSATKL